MSLAIPVKVEKLQKALHAKAKEEAGFRCYQLYDKMYRADVLFYAYQPAPDAGGIVRLSRLHHRKVLLAKDGPRLYRPKWLSAAPSMPEIA